VDLQTFHPGARDKGLRAELGIAEDTRLLIFAGRGSKEKNLPVLLKCMQRLGPRYHLLLVGSSMPAVVPDNVSVIDGFCPCRHRGAIDGQRRCPDACRRSGNLRPGDPRSHGLRDSGGRRGGRAFEEIVAEDCGLLCAPNNPQAMANAVRELFSRGCLKLGQQARQHVERRYSWDSVVDSLLGHYHAVLGHSPQEWPMADSLNDRAVLLVLHDVAPSTWADYRPFVEAVDAMGGVPMTWLVVPDFHGHDALEDHPAFCRMLGERLVRGDELALHGYYHDDREPARPRPVTGSCAESTPTRVSFIGCPGKRRRLACAMASNCSGAMAGRCTASSPRPG
jgi:hypothetical protein